MEATGLSDEAVLCSPTIFGGKLVVAASLVTGGATVKEAPIPIRHVVIPVADTAEVEEADSTVVVVGSIVGSNGGTVLVVTATTLSMVAGVADTVA